MKAILFSLALAALAGCGGGSVALPVGGSSYYGGAGGYQDNDHIIFYPDGTHDLWFGNPDGSGIMFPENGDPIMVF